MADIDKVKLEQIIDSYLENEIPLSLLMEEYELSFPQMQLLMNRTISYTQKTESLYDSQPKPSNDNISQDYVAIPHEFIEEYPLPKGEQIELFKRLAELRKIAPPVGTNIVEALKRELDSCYQALQEVPMKEVAIAEKVAQDIASMGVTGNNIADILQKYLLTPQDFQRLDKIYKHYLELRESYSDLQLKINQAKVDLNFAKKINKEIEEIRTTLVVHNMKLVNFCTRYFFSGMVLPQDEVQLYGMEGLAIAINGFNPDLGYQFSTYAVPVMIHNVEDHFKEMTGIKWSDFCRKEQIQHYREWFKSVRGETADVSADQLTKIGLVPLTKKKIERSDELIEPVVPLSDIQDSYEDETNYGRRNFPITFEEYDSIDEYIDATEVGVNNIEEDFSLTYAHELLSDVLKTLSPREAQIIVLRFGLEDGRTRTLEEVGKIFNIEPMIIRQLEARAFRKLRNPSRAKKLVGLADYLDESVVPTTLDQAPSLESSPKLR